MREGTETGRKAKSFIDAGQLVPDDVVIAIVEERLKEKDCEKGYILDGFPRTVPQAEALKAIARIDVVLNLDVADDDLISRLSGRRVCPKCGATYHLSHLGGKADCAACGESLIQRDDDKAETVKNRLAVYHRQTAPLVEYYRQAGLLKTVSGAQGMEETFEDILRVLGVES